MKKTAAIKEAESCVSIHGRGTSWVVIGPYRYDDPFGPYTETPAHSFAMAHRIRTRWRARVALSLMGRLTDESTYAIEQATGPLRSVVNAGLNAQ